MNAMQEKDHDKCNAISAMTKMQCDEVNAVNAI